MSCPEYHPDLKLCQRGYCSARAKYEKYPSAYANLYAAAVCKGQQADINGVVEVDQAYMDKLSSQKKEDNGLLRWLDEEWVNVCKKKQDGSYEACGSRDQSTYPYCRPLHRINQETPKTVDELSEEELASLCQEKQSIRPEEGKSPKRIFVDSNGSSLLEQNQQEIQEYLDNPPSTWRGLFSKAGLVSPSVDDVIEVFLSKTAGGKESGELSSPLLDESVPAEVREEAMTGIRLSYQHNYPSYQGIGLARAIQLATQSSIHEESRRRMCAFFKRNKRYQQMKGFGDDENPSKSYLAWLNWGGNSGYEWSCGDK